MSVNHAFSAMSFISFVLVVIPFPWHLESWNIGTCLYMMWTAVSLLIAFINSIIWDGNAIDSAVAWCEFSTRVSYGAGMGVHAASLVIMRRLYYIASDRSAGKTATEKKRAVIIDLCIGLGIPLTEIALYYAIQGNRYNIMEDVGCLYVVWPTPLTLFLSTLAPLILSLCSATFGVLSVLAFMKRRAEFSDTLSTHSNLNSSRYFRLMLLGSVDILVTVPFAIFYTWFNVVVVTLNEYSWDDTHAGFDRVDTFPAVIWRNQPYSWTIELQRWIFVFAALVFFAFFGFSEEARRRYHPLLTSSMRAFGKSGWTGSQMSSTAVSATLPTFKVTTNSGASSSVPKHVSMLSFSSEISLGIDEKVDPSTGRLSADDLKQYAQTAPHSSRV